MGRTGPRGRTNGQAAAAPVDARAAPTKSKTPQSSQVPPASTSDAEDATTSNPQQLARGAAAPTPLGSQPRGTSQSAGLALSMLNPRSAQIGTWKVVVQQANLEE